MMQAHQLRLVAIVLRLAATNRGNLAGDHGDQARAALLHLIRHVDAPLARTLHDANAHKPYTISLIQRDRYGSDGALHFDEGDTASWRFTLLCAPAFETLLQTYLLKRDLPHLRIGTLAFAITEAYASGLRHPDSGCISVAELAARWTRSHDTLSREVVMDFCSPTAFSLGQDKLTKAYRIISLPDARILFSSLRKTWIRLGGAAPGDAFDRWVGDAVQTLPLHGLQTHHVVVEKRRVVGFTGRVRFREPGTAETENLRFLHLLGDLAFWTGAGYQPTRGMGQVRRVTL